MGTKTPPPYFCLSGHEHTTVLAVFACDRAWERSQQETENDDTPKDAA